MANIASMAVNVLAKMRGFDQPIKKSRKEFGKFRGDLKKSKSGFSSLKSSVDSLGVSFNGLLAGGTVAGIAGLLNTTLNSVDALGKQSISLGVNISALDKYNFAAQRAGISQTRVADAIGSMNQKLGEAKAGMGRARRFFEKINIDLTQFDKLNSAQQFERLGGALNAITDQNSKVAAFGKIFGEGAGRDMVRFFASGNLAQAASDLEKVGGALTPADAKVAAAYADAVGDLSRSFSRVRQDASLLAAPQMTASLGLIAESLAIARGEKKKASAMTTGEIARTSIGKLFRSPTAHIAELTSRIKSVRDVADRPDFGVGSAFSAFMSSRGSSNKPSEAERTLKKSEEIQKSSERHLAVIANESRRRSFDPPIILGASNIE